MNFNIGDIHGYFYTARNLVNRIKSIDKQAKLRFVGDYVDRGPHNKEVVSYMIELQKEGATCLTGNHDDVINWILNDTCICNLKEFVNGPVDSCSVMSWWYYNGLIDTLVSYGVDYHKYTKNNYSYDWDAIRADFISKCPEDHKQFFKNLEIFWENDTHFSCHAFMRPDEELPRSMKFLPHDRVIECLWSRFSPVSLKQPTKWDKIGVFGHTPVKYYGAESAIAADKIRLIDVGVFKNAGLCAYCCETDEFIIEPVDDRDKEVNL